MWPYLSLSPNPYTSVLEACFLSALSTNPLYTAPLEIKLVLPETALSSMDFSTKFPLPSPAKILFKPIDETPVPPLLTGITPLLSTLTLEANTSIKAINT